MSKMTRKHLEHFDRVLLSKAAGVVPMQAVAAGVTDPGVIGLRHDVDDNKDSLATAIRMAAWEQMRGYRSTYFILHTASYWGPTMRPALEYIAALGHEIGIHANAIAAALRTGGDPAEILADAISVLREWGFDVVGVAPHGDGLCRTPNKDIWFVNDEMFAECARPEVGAPDRELRYGEHTLTLDPRPLADFGLAYETYRLPHGRYLSDSGGRWNVPPESVATGDGQLHILQHPDWWADAF